jgi:hypothetical protein
LRNLDSGKLARDGAQAYLTALYTAQLVQDAGDREMPFARPEARR